MIPLGSVAVAIDFYIKQLLYCLLMPMESSFRNFILLVDIERRATSAPVDFVARYAVIPIYQVDEPNVSFE